MPPAPLAPEPRVHLVYHISTCLAAACDLGSHACDLGGRADPARDLGSRAHDAPRPVGRTQPRWIPEPAAGRPAAAQPAHPRPGPRAARRLRRGPRGTGGPGQHGSRGVLRGGGHDHRGGRAGPGLGPALRMPRNHDHQARPGDRSGGRARGGRRCPARDRRRPAHRRSRRAVPLDRSAGPRSRGRRLGAARPGRPGPRGRTGHDRPLGRRRRGAHARPGQPGGAGSAASRGTTGCHPGCGQFRLPGPDQDDHDSERPAGPAARGWLPAPRAPATA